MTRVYCDRCKAEIRGSGQQEWVRLVALWSHSRVRACVEADPVEVSGGRLDLCDGCFCATLEDIATAVRGATGGS